MENEYQPKEREMWCRNCHEYFMRSTPSPNCIECGEPLITVVYSIIDGRKLTGNNEQLAK